MMWEAGNSSGGQEHVNLRGITANDTSQNTSQMTSVIGRTGLAELRATLFYCMAQPGTCTHLLPPLDALVYFTLE